LHLVAAGVPPVYNQFVVEVEPEAVITIEDERELFCDWCAKFAIPVGTDEVACFVRYKVFTPVEVKLVVYFA